MPLESVLFWAVNMFIGYTWGFYYLWKIETSGVERWGGNTGSLLRMEKKK